MRAVVLGIVLLICGIFLFGLGGVVIEEAQHWHGNNQEEEVIVEMIGVVFAIAGIALGITGIKSAIGGLDASGNKYNQRLPSKVKMKSVLQDELRTELEIERLRDEVERLKVK